MLKELPVEIWVDIIGKIVQSCCYRCVIGDKNFVDGRKSSLAVKWSFILPLRLVNKQFFQLVNKIICQILKKNLLGVSVEFTSVEYNGLKASFETDFIENGPYIPLTASQVGNGVTLENQVKCGYSDSITYDYYWNSEDNLYEMRFNDENTLLELQRTNSVMEFHRDIIVKFQGWNNTSIKRLRFYNFDFRQPSGLHYVGENDFVLEYEFICKEVKVLKRIKKPGVPQEIELRVPSFTYCVKVKRIFFKLSWLSNQTSQPSYFVSDLLLIDHVKNLSKNAFNVNLRHPLFLRFRVLNISSSIGDSSELQGKFNLLVVKYFGFPDKKYLMDEIFKKLNLKNESYLNIHLLCNVLRTENYVTELKEVTNEIVKDPSTRFYNFEAMGIKLLVNAEILHPEKQSIIIEKKILEVLSVF